MVLIKEFEITTGRDSLQCITSAVKETIKESGIINGIVTVEVPHTTAGVLKITSCGKEVTDDIVREMRRLIPARINYYHQDSPENAAAHIKSSLFGTSVSLIVKDGKLLREEKQNIYLAEYDGPRNRTYCVCVTGE
ncbi:MAG: YjbQ family protein [Erysipelotrichaceae bacterium]|nr:YjbQ family protein [Erysipelotrichaceae bacterium]